MFTQSSRAAVSVADTAAKRRNQADNLISSSNQAVDNGQPERILMGPQYARANVTGKKFHQHKTGIRTPKTKRYDKSQEKLVSLGARSGKIDPNRTDLILMGTPARCSYPPQFEGTSSNRKLQSVCKYASRAEAGYIFQDQRLVLPYEKETDHYKRSTSLSNNYTSSDTRRQFPCQGEQMFQAADHPDRSASVTSICSRIQRNFHGAQRSNYGNQFVSIEGQRRHNFSHYTKGLTSLCSRISPYPNVYAPKTSLTPNKKSLANNAFLKPQTPSYTMSGETNNTPWPMTYSKKPAFSLTRATRKHKVSESRARDRQELNIKSDTSRQDPFKTILRSKYFSTS
ncbi:uncharacterized protein LOC111259411 isoform X2 [Varroa jacobsoni]|nr:uncharacterized protein LOC111259411 isoform X2 [Varroa jacobsoni]